MKAFLAGGTGVIGSRLIPELVAAGHEVVATTRRTEKVAALEGLGARAVGGATLGIALVVATVVRDRRAVAP